MKPLDACELVTIPLTEPPRRTPAESVRELLVWYQASDATLDDLGVQMGIMMSFHEQWGQEEERTACAQAICPTCVNEAPYWNEPMQCYLHEGEVLFCRADAIWKRGREKT